MPPVTFTEKNAARPGGVTRKLSRNIFASLIRVIVNGLVALVLPAYLTSRLPVALYGAWVLILQLGAYVSFLDLGIQTGVAKFVAEYEAMGDEEGAGRHASAGLAMTSLAAAAGVVLTALLAWQVPRLFSTMPSTLYPDVRFSVFVVGLSLCFTLYCSVYSAVFIGLQRYTVPMALMVASRVAFTIVVVAAVWLRGGLRAMAIAAAAVNIVVALTQVVSWRRLANSIQIAWGLVNSKVLRKMIRYCSFLAVWSLGMLCVSGLDVTIVGHFDYPMTGFYAVAVMPTNLILLIISAVMGPMMPASSAMSTQRSAAEMGNILVRVTRYAVTLLLLSGLPLIVFGHSILRLWVGPEYATHSLALLRILVIANILRNGCLPYSTMVIATGRQRSATVASISEAAVNLVCSTALASRFGAIGVAYGTLIGSCVSVSLHFVLSMPATSDALAISRWRLLTQGFCRPLLVTIPSIALFFFALTFPPGTLALFVWLLSTSAIAWFFELNRSERLRLLRLSS